MRRVVGASIAAALVLTACGGTGSVASLRPDVSGQLQSDVMTLTQAAAGKNWTAARTAVAALRADLAAFRASGAITDARAQQIEATIARVAAELPAIPAATRTPTPTPSRTTRPPAPAPAPKPPKGDGHGKHGDG